MEDYLNWLSELTQDDPNHLERGAMIFADIRRPWTKLIYPSNPIIGKENNMGQEGMVPASKRQDRFVSAVIAHSHDISLPFSPFDFPGVIRGANIGAALATPYENYLLLRTPQTPVEMAQEELERLKSELMDEFLAAAKEFKTQTSQMTNELNSFIPGAGDSYQRLIRAYGQRFLHGANSSSYFCSLRQSMEFGKRYHMAFYSSPKDGNYTIVGEEKLQKELNKFERYIEKIYAYLEKTYGIRIEPETS